MDTPLPVIDWSDKEMVKAFTEAFAQAFTQSAGMPKPRASSLPVKEASSSSTKVTEDVKEVHANKEGTEKTEKIVDEKVFGEPQNKFLALSRDMMGSAARERGAKVTWGSGPTYGVGETPCTFSLSDFRMALRDDDDDDASSAEPSLGGSFASTRSLPFSMEDLVHRPLMAENQSPPDATSILPPRKQYPERRRKKDIVDKDASVKPLELKKYKTRMCRNWSQLGMCPYGDACAYAHGSSQLRQEDDNQVVVASLTKLADRATGRLKRYVPLQGQQILKAESSNMPALSFDRSNFGLHCA